MKFKNALIIGFLFTTLGFFSCKQEQDKAPEKVVETKNVKVPPFNGDLAYSLVEKQLSFGVREPGTDGHKACKDWMVNYLDSLGLKINIQEFKAERYDGKKLTGYNIMAQLNPDKKNRVLLAAHWDTRFMAEKDSNEEMKQKAISGADDGATGVAALLAIAKVVSDNPIDLGVDFLLLDLEDQGNSNGGNDSWALGAQYWARNKVPAGYRAKYGILLDMVGAKHAAFGREGYSVRFANTYLDKVWDLAKKMGYGDLFQDYNAGAIADDHYYINTIGRIPMIDIINRPMKTESGFGEYHHTHGDNIDIIDKRTLRVVGQVVTAVLYRESSGNF
jgi:Zn-dependent M28 family amino/carboxypeptidase